MMEKEPFTNEDDLQQKSVYIPDNKLIARNLLLVKQKRLREVINSPLVCYNSSVELQTKNNYKNFRKKQI